MILSQADDNALVPLELFAWHLRRQLRTIDAGEHARRVFRAFDSRCLGFLTIEDVLQVFDAVAPGVPAHVVAQVFAEVDSDADGRVSCKDFMHMMLAR